MANQYNDLLLMTVSGVTTDHGGICLTGQIESGELIRSENIEVLEMDTGTSYSTSARQIYRGSRDTYLADDTAGEISVLTDFIFMPFAPDANLIVCKQGQSAKALAAYDELMNAPEPEDEEEDIPPAISAAAAGAAAAGSAAAGAAGGKHSPIQPGLTQHGFAEPPDQDHGNRPIPVDENDPDKRVIDSKKIMLAIIIVLVIAVGALVAKLLSRDEVPDDYSDYEEPAAEETVDPDSLYDDSEEETEDTPAGLYEIASTDVKILSSDWDWDSSTREGSMYRVDAVLYVNNKSSEPVTQLDFSVISQDGDTVYDENTGNSYFTAYGYVDPGTKGFMVADVYTDEEKVRPDDETYTVQTAYNNGSIGEYYVPTGYISENYGPNNDYYDISVDNPNDFAVNQSARVVAVRVKGNKLKEGEASGRLSSYIEGETYGFVQEKAFNNPNLHSDYNDMTVYLIDTEFLRQY